MGVVALAVVPVQPVHAAAGRALDCGSVLTQSVRLTADLVCAGDALIVDGAGAITLDLNGHTVSSDGTALTIRNSGAVTVKGGSATSLTAESAVKLSDLSLGQLRFFAPTDARRLTVTGRSDGRGYSGETSFRSSTLGDVVLRGVREAVFTENVMRSLGLGDAPRTLVRGNTVGSVVVHQSDEVIVENNRVQRIGVGQSRGFHALGNQVTGNGTGIGIDLGLLVEPGLQGTIVRGNTVRGAAIGISINGTLGDVTIAGNTVEGSTVAGLTAQGLLSGRVLVRENTFKRNGFASTALDADGRTVNDGVHISLSQDRPSTGALLANNVAKDNAGYGFEVIGGAGQISDGGGNVAVRNGEGACWGIECS